MYGEELLEWIKVFYWVWWGGRVGLIVGGVDIVLCSCDNMYFFLFLLLRCLCLFSCLLFL